MSGKGLLLLCGLNVSKGLLLLCGLNVSKGPLIAGLLVLPLCGQNVNKLAC